MSKSSGGKTKNIIENRKARHEYHLLETYEAGIELKGTEVKSLRAGKGNLSDAYGRIEQGEAWLYQMHISPYEFGNLNNHEEMRPRRLLLHKAEIAKIHSKLKERGFAFIPVRMYFANGWVKVEMALAQGKKLYDKRDDIAKRDAKRDVERAFRERQRDF